MTLSREELARQVNALDRDLPHTPDGRRTFFDSVYDRAEGDPAFVPWADLKPKPELSEWLAANPGKGRTAIDIACGLGDNAEVIAAAGWQTTAFDLSDTAIRWARRRFAASRVAYQCASLLDPPSNWLGGFDLVNECYTIQSVPPDLHVRFMQAIAALVSPGGTLLVYTRTRAEGSAPSGPPWPLMPSETGWFGQNGFRQVSEKPFVQERPDRRIAHLFSAWEKA